MIFRSPLFRKLLFSAFALIAVIVLILDFYLTRYVGSREVRAVEQRLVAQARVLAAEASQTSPGKLQQWAGAAGLRAEARVTVIGRDGTVRAESERSPEDMEPHHTRPEVRQALAGRIGTATRRSSTLGTALSYVAYPMNGAVLRLAVPLTELDAAVRTVRARIILVSLLAAALSLAIAYYVASTLAHRIRRIQAFTGGLLDANAPSELPRDGNDEIGDLCVTLSRMAAQLRGLVERLHLESTRLERVERVRKDFVANVSHELRTPLTAIRGYAETLLDGALEDRENNRRFLEIIKAHTIRLNNIASDLLILSELESGRDSSEPETVSVGAALETAIRTVEAQARVRDVALICEKAEDFEVLGHRIRLEQAFVNLIDNAVKFNRPAGEVRIESWRDADGTGHISVADTGIGIPPEHQSRIFERFYRVDKARSREVGGTGLGLSIVKHVVERMGGTVRVESQVAAGSRFTISLPVRDRLTDS